jgi:dual specificity phosphatase 12
MSLIIENLILSSVSEMRNNSGLIRQSALHINAAEEVDFKIDTQHTRINLNWLDMPLQNINENAILIHLVKMIDFHLSCGKQVLVNCFAGVSRSATIVIAYLMYKNKWSFEDAITFVKSKRNIINPNYGFVCQLYGLQDILCNLDEKYNEYMSNFQNKTTNQLNEEIDRISKIPVVEQFLNKRYKMGYNEPDVTNFNTFFPF